jgi:hypothetical protein
MSFLATLSDKRPSPHVINSEPTWDLPRMAELPDRYRALAGVLRHFGAAEGPAQALEVVAQEIDAALVREQEELLSLSRAAKESGYSADHLSRLVREGKIPNAGRRNKPLIRRRNLPQKPGRQEDASSPANGYVTDRLFRDIATSKSGG